MGANTKIENFVSSVRAELVSATTKDGSANVFGGEARTECAKHTRPSTGSGRTGWVLFFFLLLSARILLPAFAASPAAVLVDDFEGEEVKNKLGNRANVFIKAPSKSMVTRREETVNGKKTHVLMIKYEKQNTGGPYNSGGWCGYYTLLKSPGALVAPTPDNPNPPPQEEQYLDGSDFKAITFWVRGEKGDENFVV